MNSPSVTDAVDSLKAVRTINPPVSGRCARCQTPAPASAHACERCGLRLRAGRWGDEERLIKLDHAWRAGPEAARAGATDSDVHGSTTQSKSASNGTSTTVPPVPQMSLADAQELAARRQHDAKVRASITGWKPLALWYTGWAALLVIVAFVSVASGGIAAFFLCLAIAVASGKYAHYLYNGGRRRVWFFFW
jgi:hypothetical protein